VGGNVRRFIEDGLVSRDQVAVLGHDEIRLDEISALEDGERVSGERMFGEITGGAAMADDDRCSVRLGPAGGATRPSCRRERAEALRTR
jgi:hypothetical protein